MLSGKAFGVVPGAGTRTDTAGLRPALGRWRPGGSGRRDGDRASARGGPGPLPAWARLEHAASTAQVPSAWRVPRDPRRECASGDRGRGGRPRCAAPPPRGPLRGAGWQHAGFCAFADSAGASRGKCEMKEAARGSGPRGPRTGSACLIAQPDRAARKCPRARRWAVGGNTQSRGDPGRPEGPSGHGAGTAKRTASPGGSRRGARRGGPGSPPALRHRDLWKNPGSGGKETSSNVFVVSENSSVEKGVSGKQTRSQPRAQSGLRGARTRVPARVRTRPLAQVRAWPALFRVAHVSPRTPS